MVLFVPHRRGVDGEVRGVGEEEGCLIASAPSGGAVGLGLSSSSLMDTKREELFFGASAPFGREAGGHSSSPAMSSSASGGTEECQQSCFLSKKDTRASRHQTIPVWSSWPARLRRP